MHVKREELATVGISVTPKDYQSAILKAILEEMFNAWPCSAGMINP